MDENWFYDEHKKMLSDVGLEKFNWHWTSEIQAIFLDKIALTGVSEEAAQWSASIPSADMHFSHGQYYGDGLQHIIDELKQKPTSNRALYSLLSQKNISSSGDRPIPSFLTFQCSIENQVLYCTASFRALEVSKFLIVNLEEIRQNLVRICSEISTIKTINLHIFAFHAYVREAALAALRKPRIEAMSEAALLLLMQRGDLNELDALVGDLKKSTTVVSVKGLKGILDNLRLPDANLNSSIISRKPQLEPLLEQSIEACKALIKSREMASRGDLTNAKITEFHNMVSKLQQVLLS